MIPRQVPRPRQAPRSNHNFLRGPIGHSDRWPNQRVRLTTTSIPAHRKPTNPRCKAATNSGKPPQAARHTHNQPTETISHKMSGRNKRGCNPGPEARGPAAQCQRPDFSLWAVSLQGRPSGLPARRSVPAAAGSAPPQGLRGRSRVVPARFPDAIFQTLLPGRRFPVPRRHPALPPPPPDPPAGIAWVWASRPVADSLRRRLSYHHKPPKKQGWPKKPEKKAGSVS